MKFPRPAHTSRMSPRLNTREIMSPQNCSCNGLPSRPATNRIVEPRLSPSPQNAVSNVAFAIPTLDSIKPPSTFEEAVRMLEVGRKMVVAAAEYKGSGIKHNERGLLNSCLQSAVMKMARANEEKLSLGLTRVDNASFIPGTKDLSSSFVGTCDSSSSCCSTSIRSSPSTTTRSPSSAKTDVGCSKGFNCNMKRDGRGRHQSPVFPSIENKRGSMNMNRDQNHIDRKRKCSSGDSE